MQRKNFKSRLFKKMIYAKHPEYWEILYAEILFRIKALEDLNCRCSFCFREKLQNKNIILQLMKDGHIPENRKPENFTGIGDCGRKLGPAA